MSQITMFQEEYPSLESYWRSVILFGNNVASYKFALAKTLLELAEQGKTEIDISSLAEPFSKHICEHISVSEKQATSPSSKFLEACKNFNKSTISKDELISITSKLGFNNVLDAFHNVNRETIPVKFFEKTGAGNSKGIILTDNIYKLKEIKYDTNLNLEVESRWRLVETAWNLSIPTHALKVEHDEETGVLFINDSKIRRKNITSVKHALNGYQKGKCFYCFDDINVSDDNTNNCDVDHFFPHTLQQYTGANLNGVWNLVLACNSCNRGAAGKFAKIPDIKYLDRLNKRNNFLVNSHHPLRETLINQTGASNAERKLFLQNMDKFAISMLIHRWEASYENEAVF